jgi:hypothetical protein
MPGKESPPTGSSVMSGCHGELFMQIFSQFPRMTNRARPSGRITRWKLLSLPASSQDSCLPFPFPIIDSVALLVKREVSGRFFCLTKRVPSSSLFGHAYTDLFTSFFFENPTYSGRNEHEWLSGEVFLPWRNVRSLSTALGVLRVTGNESGRMVLVCGVVRGISQFRAGRFLL